MELVREEFLKKTKLTNRAVAEAVVCPECVFP